MSRASVLGGPADGASVAVRGAFEFIDASGYRRRHGGSGLYRLDGRSYVFAEPDYFICAGCGSFHKREGDRCQLCGADAAPSRRGPRADG